MEKLDGSTRQSGIHAIINREKIEYNSNDRPNPTSSTMAATAVVSPAPSMYSQPPPPYSWGGHGPSVSGMVSPPGSRRTSDNKTEPPPPIQTSQPQRQSLPSIHEALTGGPKPSQYSSPISAISQSQQLPYSQPQGQQIPRSFPPPEHPQYSSQGPPQPRQPSPPQPVHPQSNPFSRLEQGPSSFSEPPRHPSLTSLQTAPAPPNPYAPRFESSRYEQDSRAQGQERAPNGYQQQPPPPPQPYNYGPPPGQMPPPGPQPVFSQPHHAPPTSREMKDSWPPQDKPEVFREGLKRHLEVYDFENSLARINTTSASIQNWSAHFNAIAQEQQRSVNIIPDRMPTLDSVDEMIRNNEIITNLLQEMKAMIYEQAQHTAHQRMREQAGRGPGDYDEDSMYDEMKSHGGYGPESKKRRGRAAPPGRCHSCNRAETPEWRRGPDGARTLCNACGLHYAKLTRKNTMKNSQGSTGSQLRPLSKDGLSPRPM